MKLGIMQPYFFPYIGYFQLINSVDKFVIYDDAQYEKGGWVNRNRILVNGKDSMFVLRIKKDNFKLKINERFLIDNFKYINNKLLKSIQLSYTKAPFYKDVINLLSNTLQYEEQNLSKFIINSLIEICKYLDINTEILISSQLQNNFSIKGREKVIYLNKILKSNTYINSIGGTKLYSKDIFKQNNIDLYFIKTKYITYKQFNENKFIPNLSIIDVLMFNSKEKVKNLLNEYELI